MQNYANAPQVFVSIITMQSFTPMSVVTYTMTVSTITNTYFKVQYSIICVVGGGSCTFT
jgi:hypothetical protein